MWRIKIYDFRFSVRNIREISRNGQGIEACYYIYYLTRWYRQSFLLFATLMQYFDKILNNNMIHLCIKLYACLPSEDAAIDTDRFLYWNPNTVSCQDQKGRTARNQKTTTDLIRITLVASEEHWSQAKGNLTDKKVS